MKVLQINSVCGYGSTGRSAVEIAKLMTGDVNQHYIAYGQGTTNYEYSYKIGSRTENHIHNILSRVLGKQGYYTKSGTKKLIKYIQEFQPDVIHLDNLHGNYLNLEILFWYLSNAEIPVVWTLHDCWAFTGKCAYFTAIDCNKWQTHCNHCPQITKYPPSLFRDCSMKMYADKKKWFTSVKNMTIVPVSRWLSEEVKQSFLAVYPIVPIYNWINQQIFFPIVSNVREQYGIGIDSFVILGVSAKWEKNYTKLQDFIKLSHMLPKGMQLVLVGEAKDSGYLPSNIICLPYIQNINELAKIYSMADVYVHLSMEDTFGKVIAEALSCGTPAIVYNSTACPEVVGAGCGIVVEARNVDQIFDAIRNIQSGGKKAFSQQCTAYANEKFNYQINAGMYVTLYEKVMTR